MMLCLSDLNGGDKNDAENTDEWVRAVNRGGLWKVTDKAYQLFLIMENELRNKFRLHSVSDESRREMVESLLTNDDLLFQWCFCATDLQQDTTNTLLKQIVELFLTVHGHGFASSLLEVYKNITKKHLSKKKALRTELNS